MAWPRRAFTNVRAKSWAGVDGGRAAPRQGVARAQLHVGLAHVAVHGVGHAGRHLRAAGVLEESHVAGQGGKSRAQYFEVGGRQSLAHVRLSGRGEF